MYEIWEIMHALPLKILHSSLINEIECIKLLDLENFTKEELDSWIQSIDIVYVYNDVTTLLNICFDQWWYIKFDQLINNLYYQMSDYFNNVDLENDLGIIWKEIKNLYIGL